MAEPGDNAEFEDTDIDGDTLWRLLSWAGCALVAVGVAVLAAQSDGGASRISSLFQPQPTVALEPLPAAPAESPLRGLPASVAVAKSGAQAQPPVQGNSQPGAPDKPAISERERLQPRLDLAERGGDVTGSVSREAAGASSASNGGAVVAVPLGRPPVPGAVAAPDTAARPDSAAKPPEAVPTSGGDAVPQRLTESFASLANPAGRNSVVTKTEFAVDVGGEATIEALRTLWLSLRTRHAALFEGLRPVIGIRDGGKPGAVDLRLIVGPLTDAAAAARLCGTLAMGGLACQPTIFDGQRLALR